MLRRLAHVSRDALVYGLAGALARMSGLILLPLFTSFFTAEQYGIYQSVTNLGALLLAVAVLGLDGAVGILYFAGDDEERRRLTASLWLLITAAVSVPLALLLALGADWLSLVATGTAVYAPLFRLGVAALPFSAFLLAVNNLLRFFFKARTYALLNLGLTALTVGLIVALVGWAHMGLEGALWGTLLGNALITVPAAWAVRGRVSLNAVRDSPAARATARRMFQLGLPLVPASVALWVTNFSNTYFLLQLAGAAAAGVFRIGAQIAALLSLAVWAFQLAWGPYSLSIAREPDAPRTYSRMALIFMAGAVGASVLLAALAPIILRLLTTRAYAEAAAVIGLLSLSAAASGAYQVVALGANLAQRTGPVAWTAIAAAVANVVLNLALIPVWGIVGAGLASLAANLLSAGLVYRMSQRLHPIPYAPERLLMVWLIGSACVAFTGVFNMAVEPSMWLSALVTLLLGFFYVGALLALRVVTRHDLDVLRAALQRRAGRLGERRWLQRPPGDGAL